MINDSIENRNVVRPGTDRSFGLIFAVFFGVVALYRFYSGADQVAIWFVCCLAFTSVALVIPLILHPLNIAWFKFGMLLHHIVSPISLGIMFFLVITPYGLLMRFLGKRPLLLDYDPIAKSYWIERNPPGPSQESFNNQF
jgi:hypothetical protein